MFAVLLERLAPVCSSFCCSLQHVLDGMDNSFSRLAAAPPSQKQLSSASDSRRAADPYHDAPCLPRQGWLSFSSSSRFVFLFSLFGIHGSFSLSCFVCSLLLFFPIFFRFFLTVFPSSLFFFCPGGEDKRSQIDPIQKLGVHCIVATPGRISDLLHTHKVHFDLCK